MKKLRFNRQNISKLSAEYHMPYSQLDLIRQTAVEKIVNHNKDKPKKDLVDALTYLAHALFTRMIEEKEINNHDS